MHRYHIIQKIWAVKKTLQEQGSQVKAWSNLHQVNISKRYRMHAKEIYTVEYHVRYGDICIRRCAICVYAKCGARAQLSGVPVGNISYIGHGRKATRWLDIEYQAPIK